MAQSSMLHVRVGDDIKARATEARAMTQARAARFSSGDALLDGLEKTG